MNKVQFIKTETGEELAVLPRAEYDRLVERAENEDMGTARLLRRAEQAITSGREFILPKGEVDRLAAGENPIRVLREWRDLTQAEVAVGVGITQSYLSDLEAGRRKGPLELHQRIARKLGVPLDLLAPIAVTREKAGAARLAERGRVVARMKRSRGRR